MVGLIWKIFQKAFRSSWIFIDLFEKWQYSDLSKPKLRSSAQLIEEQQSSKIDVIFRKIAKPFQFWELVSTKLIDLQTST